MWFVLLTATSTVPLILLFLDTWGNFVPKSSAVQACHNSRCDCLHISPPNFRPIATIFFPFDAIFASPASPWTTQWKILSRLFSRWSRPSLAAKFKISKRLCELVGLCFFFEMGPEMGIFFFRATSSYFIRASLNLFVLSNGPRFLPVDKDGVLMTSQMLRESCPWCQASWQPRC